MMVRLKLVNVVILLYVTVLEVGFAKSPRNRKKRNKKISSFLKHFVHSGGAASGNSEQDIISRCLSVDVALTSTRKRKATLLALADAGFNATACYGKVCSGCVPPNQLNAVAALKEVAFIHPVLPQLSSGSVQTQGDTAMKTDLVRQNLGVDGTGVKIGVLSDSFNCLGQYDPNTLAYQDDIASGDLPSNIDVVFDYTYDEFLQVNQYQSRPCTDEGRAMLQLIYDVAPGAQLAFYSGWGGKAAMASGINALAAAGCNIIVDDLTYPDVAFFQDDVTALAVGTVTSQGVAYFSAAGNLARQSWESAFEASGQTGPGGGQLHNFGNGVIYQEVNVDSQGIFSFQWDEPFGTACNLPFCPGSTNNVDIYATNPETGQVLSSTDNNVDSNPFELINLPAGRWQIQIELVSGSPPGLMKWIFWGLFGATPVGADKSTLFGHANAANAAAVGSAFWGNTPVYGTDPATVEPQSALGGTSILFDTNGNRLASPEVRMQPRFVGPDGGSTTFFGTSSNDQLYFYGTSAAAPHVAAGAALLLGISPNMDPPNLYNAIERTALDMDNPYTSSFDTGFDYRTGYGFVDFQAAAQAVGGPTVIPIAAPSVAPTLGSFVPSPGGSTVTPTQTTSLVPSLVPSNTTGTPSFGTLTSGPTLSNTLSPTLKNTAGSPVPSSAASSTAPNPVMAPSMTPGSVAPNQGVPTLRPSQYGSPSISPSMTTGTDAPIPILIASDFPSLVPTVPGSMPPTLNPMSEPSFVPTIRPLPSALPSIVSSPTEPVPSFSPSFQKANSPPASSNDSSRRGPPMKSDKKSKKSLKMKKIKSLKSQSMKKESKSAKSSNSFGGKGVGKKRAKHLGHA